MLEIRRGKKNGNTRESVWEPLWYTPSMISEGVNNTRSGYEVNKIIQHLYVYQEEEGWKKKRTCGSGLRVECVAMTFSASAFQSFAKNFFIRSSTDDRVIRSSTKLHKRIHHQKTMVFTRSFFIWELDLPVNWVFNGRLDGIRESFSITPFDIINVWWVKKL